MSEKVVRTRMTLDLSQKLNEHLERLASEQGVSKAEVLRDAIDLLVRANRAANDGLVVGAFKIDDENKVVVQREFSGAGLP